MDMISMEELKTLSARYPGWRVSLFMPTHRRGRETEQDPIRFRNLLRQVEERLQAKGLRPPDVQQIMKPAQRLLDDPGFWRRQSDGLALFLTAEESHIYRLPLAFEELVVISERFHLKPILPFFAGDGHFYVLALSQNQVRLLEGSRYTVDEIDLENVSKSMAEALQYERFEKQLQFHTSSAAGGGKRPAVFHGHDISDEDKGRILRWFHKIDAELSTLLANERSPLALAGVNYLHPLYREANSYAHLLEEGIIGNPDDLKPEELHAQAWPLMEPIFMQAREKALAQYQQLAGSERATNDVAKAVLAAHHGRVDTLFVAVGVQIWGRFDPESASVHTRQTPEPGDEDLLDLAAVQTLLNGGEVYAIETEQIPDQAPLAAIFRY